MKTICNTIVILLAAALCLMVCGCTQTDSPGLRLDGTTQVQAITVNGFDAEIDHTARTLTVHVPTGVDLTALTVDKVVLSPGASCDYPDGTVFNGTVPRALRVTNGDVYTVYTLIVQHDNVEFLTFTLDGKYAGTIDNAARTILCFVPVDADVTAMQADFTVTDGAVVDPASGSVMDFSQPVCLKATLRTAAVQYTVTVIKDGISQAPKAFVGNALSVDGLGNEARTACRWMLDNVPNSRYVSIRQIIDGSVKLDDFKMIWCHFDWLDWPGQMWDSRDLFNRYWMRGGAILASRDGARYINDVWRIARDQQSPNNMFGGDATETLKDDFGFTVKGHEDHPLFDGLQPDADSRIRLLAKGCSFTNRTLQWGADWDPYGSIEGWRQRTGATELASGHDYDVNRVTIAEFAPYEALKGYTSGRVITIGTPAYEWFDGNGADNPYRANMIRMTKNAINYLCQ